jgi:hypothetical protein
MSIITFIKKALSRTDRNHYRKVGKQTIIFCRRASKISVNEHQRRILMSAAISSDEVVAALLGLDHKRNAEAFNDRHAYKKLRKEDILAVMRCYLSALLIMCVTFKKMLLSKVEMSENNFMVGWRLVFEYSMADMQLFDEELAPAFRNRGIDGLVETMHRHVINTLFQEKQPLSEMEAAFLRDMILDDTAAIKRYVEK